MLELILVCDKFVTYLDDEILWSVWLRVSLVWIAYVRIACDEVGREQLAVPFSIYPHRLLEWCQVVYTPSGPWISRVSGALMCHHYLGTYLNLLRRVLIPTHLNCYKRMNFWGFASLTDSPGLVGWLIRISERHPQGQYEGLHRLVGINRICFAAFCGIHTCALHKAIDSLELWKRKLCRG